MCGIFGFAKNEKELSAVEEHQLRGMVMDLACLNESRGKDGTGLALMSKSELVVLKEAKPAIELFKTRRFRDMIRKITSRTLLCLGHTRLATVGSVHNDHCHPFVSDDYVGVHNGHFLNRENLLKKYRKSAQTPVDSEAIFRVLDGSTRMLGVVSRLEEMNGDFALGFAHLEDPFQLYLVRNEERPLHVAYVKQLEALIWASEREHLEFSLVRNDLEAKVYEIQKDHLYCADVRRFNGKSHMKKLLCKIEPSRWERWHGASEEDFHLGQGQLFDFDDLRSAGYLEGSGITECSKIPCAGCECEIEAVKLFYDEVRGEFICESCSFDFETNTESNLENEVI